MGRSATNAGSGSFPIGTYVYAYRFCLCPLLNGEKTEPGSLTLHVYADDAFVAKLNGNVIGQKLTGWSFTSSSPPAPKGSVTAAGGTLVTAKVNFQCDNVLTFEVKNGMVSPTGLDVFGTITGYFGPQPIPEPGRPCNCAGDRATPRAIRTKIDRSRTEKPAATPAAAGFSHRCRVRREQRAQRERRREARSSASVRA